MLDQDQRDTLLRVAADSIHHGLRTGKALPVSVEDFPPALGEVGASFVTLKINEQLRGCIGTLEAFRPLIEDVANNAYAAAFGDPRFPPLTEAEYPKLQYHISVLAPPEPLPCTSEDELLAALRPGVDGLVIEDQGHRATFLPSVWESLPTPTLFLQHLKTKAGLSNTHWSDTFSCQRYTVEEFGSHDRQA
jgi:hypothetical protein